MHRMRDESSIEKTNRIYIHTYTAEITKKTDINVYTFFVIVTVISVFDCTEMEYTDHVGLITSSGLP